MTKITKEKTARIIPNAVGVCTEDDVKHIFASLLSRDTTFKLMTRLWKRTIREAGRHEHEDLMLADTVRRKSYFQAEHTLYTPAHWSRLKWSRSEIMFVGFLV